MVKPPIAVTAEMLRDHRLLRGVSEPTIARFAAELTGERVDPGALLMREGVDADHMFLVIHGEFEVLAQGTDGPVRVALLGPNAWLGEMAVLGVRPRSATVRALAPTLVLRATDADLRRLTDGQGEYLTLVLNIARELSQRLRVADGLIARSGATMAQEYVHLSMRPPRP